MLVEEEPGDGLPPAWPMLLQEGSDDAAVVEQDIAWTSGAVVDASGVTLPDVAGEPLRVSYASSSTLSATGRLLWSGSLVMAEWLLAHGAELAQYDQVLELGCGVGFVWTVLQRLGCANVIATDVDAHVTANGCPVHAYDWRTPDVLPPALRLDRRTLIIAADVIYDVALTAALANALRVLFSRMSPKPTALVALERRVVWLFGDEAPSCVAHDEWLRQLQGAVAAPMPLYAVPHVLPFERNERTMQLWYLAHM